MSVESVHRIKEGATFYTRRLLVVHVRGVRGSAELEQSGPAHTLTVFAFLDGCSSDIPYGKGPKGRKRRESPTLYTDGSATLKLEEKNCR